MLYVILGEDREELGESEKAREKHNSNPRTDKALVLFLLSDEPGVLKTRKENNSLTFTVNARPELRHKATLCMFCSKNVFM